VASVRLWIILFGFRTTNKLIDLLNEVLNFAQKEGESLGAD
jgi:hypothetical protein